jgi:hypothetical protein
MRSVRKILQFWKKVSVTEGLFLLKLIQHQLNIEANTTTVQNTDVKVDAVTTTKIDAVAAKVDPVPAKVGSLL